MLLQIDDGSRWDFVNGTMRTSDDGYFVVTEDPEETQMHTCAICRDKAYSDFKTKFQFIHNRISPQFVNGIHKTQVLSDVGFIFRATSKTDFFVLHFPYCKQATVHSKNFWIALSKMDETGVLKLVDLQLVNRVVSDVDFRHQVELEVSGDTVQGTVDEKGRFVFTGIENRAGRVGVTKFGFTSIKDVQVEGADVENANWDAGANQKENWFHPLDDEQYGQLQGPKTLIKNPNGTLMLEFYACDGYPRDKGNERLFLITSQDKGLSWSKPVELDSQWHPEIHMNYSNLHVFPDGRVGFITLFDKQFFIRYMEGDCRTWSAPEVIRSSAIPRTLHGFTNALMGRSCLNLSDGNMVFFIIGDHYSSSRHAYGSIDGQECTWSAKHTQAHAAVSSDGGTRISPYVNMDNVSNIEGRPIEGSMDLTEVSAVETDSGRILALVRPVYGPWYWETWSDDGGKTWEPVAHGPFPGYAASNLLKTSSGKLVMAHRIPGTCIHMSPDGGISWDEGTMIDNSGVVMGSMEEVDEDLVLYVYFSKWDSKMRGQFLSVTHDGLVPVWRDSVK